MRKINWNGWGWDECYLKPPPKRSVFKLNKINSRIHVHPSFIWVFFFQIIFQLVSVFPHLFRCGNLLLSKYYSPTLVALWCLWINVVLFNFSSFFPCFLPQFRIYIVLSVTVPIKSITHDIHTSFHSYVCPSIYITFSNLFALFILMVECTGWLDVISSNIYP